MATFKDSKQQENARWVTQCALLDNMFAMSKIMGSPYPGAIDGIEPDSAYPGAGLAGASVQKAGQHSNTAEGMRRQKYDVVRASRNIPKNAILYQAPPEFTVAHLMRQTDASPFFEATPAQLSSLEPKISIEVLHNNKWEKVRFASKAVQTNLDNRQALLLTDESVGEGVSGYLDMVLGDEYLADGGIKRFEFNFDNNMFYEKNIKATLELHFKNASDLGLSIYRRLFRLSDGLTESGASKKKPEQKQVQFREIRDCAVLLKNAGIKGLQYIQTKEGGKVANFSEGDTTVRGLSPNIGTIFGNNTEARDRANELLSISNVNVKSSAGNIDPSTFNGYSVSWVDGWLNDETTVAKTSRSKYLKATIGWADYNADIEGFDKKLTQAVKETQRTFILNMTDYDIDFKEDGQVAVTFNYIASIDAFTRQSPKMDILEKLFADRTDSVTKISSPKEYDYVLAAVPDPEDVKKLYRPLATYAALGRRLSNDPVLKGFLGTGNDFAEQLDNARAVDFSAPEQILSLRQSRLGEAQDRLRRGASIERSKFYTYSGSDTAITTNSLQTVRRDKVSGGGYLITRLVYQLEDPFGTGRKVFQVQEKGILAEMSLISKEIRYAREELKLQKTEAQRKVVQANVKSLQAAYSVAKSILVSARTFRRTVRSSGFLKSFRSNNILRMASLRAIDFQGDEEGSAITIKEYQKGGRARVDFHPVGYSDVEIPDTIRGNPPTGGAVELKRYLTWFDQIAGEKTYGKNSTYSDAVRQPIIDSKGYAFIPFVQLGHLLSHMMGSNGSREDGSSYGMILGTIKIPNEEGTPIVYNISDIPISLPLLMTWYFKQVIDTGREVYPFRTAMRDILTDLVHPMLTRFCLNNKLQPGESPPNIKFSTLTTTTGRFFTRADLDRLGQTNPILFDPGAEDSQVTVDPQGKKKFRKDKAFAGYIVGDNRLAAFAYTPKQLLANPVPHSQVASAPASKIMHYYVLHSTTPSQRSGDYNKDMKEGIYHLILGRDRGILKRINFSRKEMPYLESRNIEQGSAGNLDAVLTIPMDADVELFGNNFFQHGQMVYLNAEFGLGKNLAESMRVGGYYMVTKVNNSLDNSGWTTSLKCIWQSQAYSDTSWGGDP